jgi:hypothetical protein
MCRFGYLGDIFFSLLIVLYDTKNTICMRTSFSRACSGGRGGGWETTYYFKNSRFSIFLKSIVPAETEASFPRKVRHFITPAKFVFENGGC